MTTWRWSVAALVAVVPLNTLTADEAEAKAVKAVEAAGGSILRVDRKPDTPVWKVALDSTRGSEAIIPQLKAIKKLRFVEGSHSDLTGKGFNELADLKELRSVALNRCPITDEGLKDVCTLTGLTALWVQDLSKCKSPDAVMKYVARLKDLESLDLGNAPITDAGLKELAGLTRLKHLCVNSPNVTDEGIKVVSGMKGMVRFEFNNSKVTDAGLVHLKDLKNLRRIDYRNTKITEAAVAELKKSIPALKGIRDP